MHKSPGQAEALSAPTIDVSAYRNEWVALNPQTYEVVSHHQCLETAIQMASDRGFPRPLLMPVPESDAYFVGFTFQAI